MILLILFLVTGLIGLWVGSGLVVESAKKIAAIFRISQTLVGLTIISIGTSLPEIMTNVFSGFNTLKGVDSSGIAVGTNIGSCLTQITLILGFVALIGTMYSTKKLLRRDGIMVLVAIAAMFLAGLNGFVSKIEGLALIIGYLIYLVVISRDEHVGKKIKEEIKADNSHDHKIMRLKLFLLMIIGIAILLGSSKLVVDNAIGLAEKWGVAQSFIGVMIIGVGTGLPELSTALRAILKKAGDISIGTLIGSNITDPMFSLGSGAVVSGFLVDKNLLFFDIPFWFFATLLALLLLRRKMKIGKGDRKEGLILIGLYALFVFLKIKFFLH